jgi:hypothetical protein
MFAMGDPPFRPLKEIARAIDRGDLSTAIAISRDFASEHKRPIPLALAATLLPLVARQSPREYDAYALRWLARWAHETAAATIDQAADVAEWLADLPTEPSAIEQLIGACQRGQRG